MNKRYKIGIGAVTRRRPQMFAALLDTFKTMDLPEDCDIVFLFAENDDALTVGPITQELAAATGLPVRLEKETRKGIPFGRNKVLDMAFAEGCDYLTFVDDDELVTKTWLVTLFQTALKRGLDLAGGPIVPVAPPGKMSGMNKGVLRHLQYVMKRRAFRRTRHVKLGTDDTLNVYTNNWCARLAAVSQFKVRFNETMVETGGSDTRFSLDMKAAGARIGWVPDAIVEEPTPQKRLQYGYHYRRARDQSLNTVILNERPPWASAGKKVFSLLDALALVLAFPIYGHFGLAKATYKFGVFMGRLSAALGGKSRHYSAKTQKYHTEVADPEGTET